MNGDEAATARRSHGLLDAIIMALRFFSRLPTGKSSHRAPELGVIARGLPVASVIIALGPAVLLAGGAMTGLPPYFAAALAVGALVLAGGAMTEDALADAADGLFGGQSRERRLEIMKDSRHGTYGVAALCLFLLLRVTALGAVEPLMGAAILLIAAVGGRSGGLWLAVALPLARSDGVAAAAGGLAKRDFAVGAAVALVLMLALAVVVGNVAGLALGLALSVMVVGGWTVLCRRLVGGQTGDLIGALCGLVEIALLSGLVIFA